jgi:hypothetical protein
MAFTVNETDRAYLPMIESDHLVQSNRPTLNWAEAGLHHIQGGTQCPEFADVRTHISL